MRLIRSLGVVGAAVVVSATVSPAAASAAGTYEAGQWYYTNFNLAKNLPVADGKGITVALIDGGIDPSVPELAGAKLVTQSASSCLQEGAADPASPVTTGEQADHATSLAVMLLGNGQGNWDGRGGRGVAPGATVLHYRNSTELPDGKGTTCVNAQGQNVFDETTAAAIDDAVAKGARVVNMSFGSADNLEQTQTAMAAGMRKGVVFVAATDDLDDPVVSDRFPAPAKLNGVVVVNAIDSDSKLYKNSLKSPLVTVASPGVDTGTGGFNPAKGYAWDSSGYKVGSSGAAAWTSGVLADAMTKWPDATGNQILQLLTQTTGGQFAPAVQRSDDGFGFGVPSLSTMIANSPMDMPDRSPLLRDGASPPTQEITGGSDGESSSPSATASTPTDASSSPRTSVAAAPADDSGGIPAWVWIVVALVVVAAIAAGLVLAARGRRTRGGPPTPPSVGPPPGGPPVHSGPPPGGGPF